MERRRLIDTVWHALRLMRWPDHVLFTIPATLLGIALALELGARTRQPLPGVLVLAANLLAVAFAFMVNDIADAPDDAADAQRGARNVVANGQLRPSAAWIGAIVVGLLALVLYATTGPRVLAAGALTILLGALYSLRPLRLKARPVVDVIAHVLMLATLLLLAGWLAYRPALRAAWIPAAAVAALSAYGQLYNQLRDREADRRAGLHNSTSLLGAGRARRVMHSCLAAGVLGLALSVGQGAIPPGVVVGAIVLAPGLLVWRSATDMRGSPALDWSGQLQTGAMLLATLLLLAWVGYRLLGL